MLTPALAVPIGVVLNTSDGVGMLNPGGRIRSDPVGSSLTEIGHRLSAADGERPI